MTTERMKAMLKYLPCKAAAVPLNLRQFLAAEQEGLALYDGNTQRWTVTTKGQAFLDGTLPPPKGSRFR